jgi:hypothetical protein
MAEASKIAKVGLLLGALGGVGFGIYYFAQKRRAQAGASQTSGQGTTQQGGITGGALGANIPSSGSCPTCGGGMPSAPSQPPPSQPSQPSPPSTPGAPYPPPNISTLIGLISGQLTPTPPTPVLQELLGRQGPQAPTPALQYLLGQAPAPGGITIGPIRILF